MRNITDVITVILRLIPDTEIDFRKGLKLVAERADYTAPEIIDHRWAEGSDLLGKYLPEPGFLNGWQRQVVELWTGREP